MTSLEERLDDFRNSKRFKGKGQLCVALVITRAARTQGLPLNADTLTTPGTGQVAGLGKAVVQAILKEYGIVRVLAEEGGRTSRGSLGNMRDYVAFLNDLHAQQMDHLEAVEKWWVDRAKDFFSGKPFVLRYDPSKSLRSIVSDLLDQAKRRQKDNPGTTYVGTVLQHLVGAKLDLILSAERQVDHHGASVADASTDRAGDFLVDNVSIHVTTAPTESLIRKCRQNLDSGLRPIIVTTFESRAGMESLAKGMDIDGRIDIIEAEQFVATNIFEWSGFTEESRKREISRLIAQYNVVVEKCETDPSLLIEI